MDATGGLGPVDLTSGVDDMLDDISDINTGINEDKIKTQQRLLLNEQMAAGATQSGIEGPGGPGDTMALMYIASYPDLINAFGADASAGYSHWFDHGFSEGRDVTFDPGAYLAANPDVQAALGDDYRAAAAHYINHGYAEGRPTA